MATSPTTNQQAANATNQFMNDWNSKNPTGYADDRSFMVADKAGYWAHQNKRKQAYDAWSAGGANNSTQATGTGVANNAAGGIVRTNSTPSVQAFNQGAGMATAQNQQYPYNQQQSSAQRQATSGGIVGSQVAANAADGTINTTQGYNAAQVGAANKWNVNADQTVQGQLGNILSRNSGLMQQAESRAMEQMNSRGLVNSSMALTAGQSAVYDTAMPIAQQDAETHAKSAGYNADIQNQFDMQNTAWQNEANQFGADAANKAGLANQGNTTERWGAQLDADTRTNLGELDAKTRMDLGHLDANTRMDLGHLDANTRMDLGRLDSDTRLNLGQLDADVRREGYSSQERMNAADNSTRRYDIDTTAAVNREMGYLDANTRTALASMSERNKMDMLRLDSEYKLLIQNNANAQSIMQQAMINIANSSVSNMSSEGKSNAANSQMQIARDALRSLSSAQGIPNMGQWFNTSWGGFKGW